MAQIMINNLSFTYEGDYTPIFDHVTLNLDSDWKTGLIGRNGRGKTTLLKLLSGSLQPTEGRIESKGSISYFPYPYHDKYQNTLDIIKETIGGIRTMELQMEALQENEVMNTEQSEQYIALLEAYQEMSGYEIESIICKELEQMQLSAELLNRDFQTLSGGEKTCMQIIALFLRKDPYVLLDEPTNHLDVKKKEVLAGYLVEKKGYIVVSHDWEFLDKVTDHILSINRVDLTLEQGNYSSWRMNMELKEQYEIKTKEKLLREINQLKKKAAQTRNWSDAGNKQKYEFAGNFRTNGTQSYMRQAKQAEGKIAENLEQKKTLLQNMEKERRLNILQEKAAAGCVVTIDDLCFSYDVNHDSECKYLIDHLSLRIIRGDRIWLKGRNGAGKSTLLRLLCGELKGSTSVHYAAGLRIALSTQEPEWKYGNVRELFFQSYQPQDTIRAAGYAKDEIKQQYTTFVNLCFMFDLPKTFDKRPIETLSSGEIKKLDIARALSMENQLLLLDEPLNFMDVNFREQLTTALCKSNSTVVFVEHNTEFGERTATRIIEL